MTSMVIHLAGPRMVSPDPRVPTTAAWEPTRCVDETADDDDDDDGKKDTNDWFPLSLDRSMHATLSMLIIGLACTPALRCPAPMPRSCPPSGSSRWVPA